MTNLKLHFSTCGQFSVTLCLLLQLAACVKLASNKQVAGNATSSQPLEVASVEQQAGGSLSATSHKILASGWPVTSPMWPTIDTQDSANGNDSKQQNKVETFIYADEPRKIDYSLLLSLNRTLIELIKSKALDSQRQIGVNLSFEYYFNHDQQVELTPPAIKIEIDRSEFRFLKPGAQPGDPQAIIKTRVWLKFDERIRLNDFSGLDNADWLKFSLVNRRASSLVAIRRLRVDFISEPRETPIATADFPPATAGLPPATAGLPPATAGLPPATASGDNELAPPAASPELPPAQNAHTQRPARSRPPGQKPPIQSVPQQPAADDAEPGYEAADSLQPQLGAPSSATDQLPQASNVLTSTIKPVEPKRSGWTGWGRIGRRRRRKREATASDGGLSQEVTIIELTCYKADACDHWRTTEPSDRIQWSLARMPPSIDPIRRGYHYASNVPGSLGAAPGQGASVNLLRLELNETEQATNADRGSDHCVELAVYVTEQARLKLFRLDRRQVGAESPQGVWAHEQQQQQAAAAAASGYSSPLEEASWLKGELLLSWAPTVRGDLESSGGAISGRLALPGAQMVALNQSGWTFDTICFGQFFTNLKECGAGQCAFGFEMGAQQQAPAIHTDHSSNGIVAPDQSAGAKLAEQEQGASEQVVGVAVLREFAISVARRPAERWLQSWNRAEVSPALDWRLFPSLDQQVVANDNVSLLNMFDRAHYSMHSEWLHADEALDFEAMLSIERVFATLSAPQSNATALKDTQEQTPEQRQQQQQRPADEPVIQLAGSEKASDAAQEQMFELRVTRKLVNSNFEQFFELTTSIEWPAQSTALEQPLLNNANLAQPNQLVQYSLSLPELGEQIRVAHQAGKLIEVAAPNSAGDASSEPAAGSRLFKLIIELELFCRMGSVAAPQEGSQFRFTVFNVSLADRCYPSPCEFGHCHQQGTKLDEWSCDCVGHHRGRRCELGKWCEHQHVAPVLSNANGQHQPANSKRQLTGTAIITKQVPNGAALQQQQQQAISSPWLTNLLTGEQFCAKKLGQGSMCNELNVQLNNVTYQDEGQTFACSCKGDFYLGDEGKCRKAHLCNSIVCPEIGQICDESKSFNSSQPCQCNERLDWYADTFSPPESGVVNQKPLRCVRRQCHDKMRDCGFDAHICLPTVPGELPVCRCGPKFALRTITADKQTTTGAGATTRRECQSTACALPTLNDCQQICVPNNGDLQRPWRCECHLGYTLDKDGRSCRPNNNQPVQCKPSCDSRTQICTELGCRCKQGFAAEGAQIVQIVQRRNSSSSQQQQLVDYTRAVHCLNVCSLSYAENKEEFERIESVCPLGLCEPATFECRCSDPNSAALVHTKYEPIWANVSTAPEASYNASDQVDTSDESLQALANQHKRRTSPLCHLKRVCQPEMAGFQLCRARGAICVPDYTKAAMFECVCPPSSERRPLAQTGEFVCEPRCSSVRQDCLKKQAICRPIDKNQVSCDCLPGMMLDKEDQKCYLARFSYSLQLILVNKYYEPESRFHKLVAVPTNSSATSSGSMQLNSLQDGLASERPGKQHDWNLQEIMPQFQRQQQQPAQDRRQQQQQQQRSMFIADFNQCNISQVIPKSILEDPYEHDLNSYLGYMDQCNERVHENARTYHLNSMLAEDLRQSLRQHLNEFTVYTNQSLCHEVWQQAEGTAEQQTNSISYLNCTIFLQSMEPINDSEVTRVLSACDKNAVDARFCWIKPRLLLAKYQFFEQSNLSAEFQQANVSNGGKQQLDAANYFKFKQIIPCQLEGFCGDDAYSVRHDNTSSLCSCKCPADIEMIDLKELEPRRSFIGTHSSGAAGQLQLSELSALSSQQQRAGGSAPLAAVKEICAPRNRCLVAPGANVTTFCLHKPGSICTYDIRTGSRCQCVHPAYEDAEGRCIEVAFSRLDSTLIVLLIMIGTCLIVSIAFNLYALVKSRRSGGSLFGHSKQYPMHEFSSATAATTNRTNSRHLNRSTGMPNLAFHSDEE